MSPTPEVATADRIRTTLRTLGRNQLRQVWNESIHNFDYGDGRTCHNALREADAINTVSPAG